MENDPTAEEMRTFLNDQYMCDEGLDFDIESAIYWFAYAWHGGQRSNLYSALSTSEYKPGPSHKSAADDDGLAADMVMELEDHFIDADTLEKSREYVESKEDES